jgi:TonB family protein
MMKYICPLLFLLVISKVGFSQQNTTPEFDTPETSELKAIYDDEDPEFPGGYPALMKYIQENLIYPQDAIEKNLQGRVAVKFNVDSNGKVNKVEVVRGIPECEACNQEAIRVVSNMPNWIPVKENGVKTGSWMMIPINFVLGAELTKTPSFGDGPEIIELDEEKTKQYDAHWAGMDIGTLILMNENFNTNFDAYPYWKNNIAKSISLNLNFYEYKVPFVKQYFGMTTGLGVSISTIGFKDNYLLKHDQNSTYALKDTLQSYKTNSLTSYYLTVPLLLEFSSKAKQKKSGYVTAGVVGGLRFASSTTKTGKYANGDRFQNIVRSNYNLTPFTLDAMFRAGYDWFGVYASYQMTSLFMKGKTVIIYPLKVGVTFNMNFYQKEKDKA